MDFGDLKISAEIHTVGAPSRSDLAQMGLSGLAVMSDRDALAIRGLGFTTTINHSMGTGGCCGPRGSWSPSAKVVGNSFATMNVDAGTNSCPTCTQSGGSHSKNPYNAMDPTRPRATTTAKPVRRSRRPKRLTASAR
jgi:hypothetical protein